MGFESFSSVFENIIDEDWIMLSEQASKLLSLIKKKFEFDLNNMFHLTAFQSIFTANNWAFMLEFYIRSMLMNDYQM